MNEHWGVKRIVAPAIAALIAGCGGFGGSPASAIGSLGVGSPSATSAHLSHVVVIIQENRSFDNFFAGFPGADAPLEGCALGSTIGARGRHRVSGSRVRRRTTSINCPSGDIVIPLQKVGFVGAPDLQHNWHSSKVSYNKGRMDGFSMFGYPGEYEAYSYVDPTLSQPYWQIAQQYVLADAMFPTQFGGSFTGHLTAVAGNDNIRQKPEQAEVDFPDGTWDDCDSPPGTASSYLTVNGAEHFYQGPFPCFDQWNTMAQVLDQSGISWKMYASKRLHAGMWEPFEASKYVRYGPDWTNDIIAPQTQVLKDAKNNNLPSVTWVTPSKADSDHPGDGGAGPSWVGSVINAIGESSYWNSTAIIVIWDDYGGWYDDAKPPQLDLRGLGIRVPCLIVSPYAKQGYVSHVQYEYGSILRFIEEVYGLPPGAIGPADKGYTDGRAATLDDAFDFTQAPRQFTPFGTTYRLSHFLREPPSNEPVDTE
jgi:phospholipase C